MKKKLLARALALVMSLSLLSSTAFAARPLNPGLDIDDDGSLKAYKDSETLDQSYDYYLDQDIVLDKTLVIKDGANASIDLNGYNLSLNKDLEVDTENATFTEPENAKVGSVIEVTGEGTSLTVTDNSDDANGTISGGYNPGVSPAGFGGGIKVDGNASLDLQGGTITNNVAGNGGGVYVGKGTVEMSGNAKIDGNLAIMGGGGVYLNTELASRTDDEAVFTMNGGTISNNTASGKDANGIIVGGGGGIGTNLYAESPDPDYAAIVINGGTITGNKAEGAGAGIFVDNGKVTINNATISNNTAAKIQGEGTTQNGGGIFAAGAKTEVTVTNSTISGNTATNYGGGIHAQQGATVNMDGTTISGNSAQFGGGVFNWSSAVTMNGGEIKGNTAPNGGGVYNYNGATFVMENGNIDSNTGHGVFNYYNSIFNMKSGAISGNTAASGAGVYNNHATLIMEDGKIIGNTATNYGGGVFNNTNSSFTMSDGSITENAANYGGGVFNNTNSTFTMTGGTLYINSASVFADDVYAASSATTTLVSASSMNAVGADGKPITGWYVDNSSRYGYGSNPYSLKDGALLESGYVGVLNLKAAHDQYFSVLDGDNNTQLANVEKGTVLNLNEDIAAPTLDGYEFIGWVLDNEVVESVTVTEEITLGSLWRHVDHNTATRMENVIPAQIGMAGSYDEVTYCTVCGEVLNRVTVTTPALEPDEPEVPDTPDTPDTPDEPGITIPDPDVPMAGAPEAETTIEDEAVPLAGIVTLAEMLEELRQREEIAETELPEDFKFIDHDYAQALYWALAEGLVVDTEEEPLDPDEILTVGLMQKVLDNFVANYKEFEDFTVAVEGEADEMVMDLSERLAAFYADLEQAEAK